jgi:hypothetical protein
MKRQRIYVDTSVIGGCFDHEFAPWSNGLFREFHEGHFIPVVSHLVAAEIVPAPSAVQEKYKELLEIDPEILEGRSRRRPWGPSTWSIASCPRATVLTHFT